jgi:hypothetical protein
MQGELCSQTIQAPRPSLGGSISNLDIVHSAFFLPYFASRYWREQEGVGTRRANSAQRCPVRQCHNRLLPRIHLYLSARHLDSVHCHLNQ